MQWKYVVLAAVGKGVRRRLWLQALVEGDIGGYKSDKIVYCGCRHWNVVIPAIVSLEAR
jgi:hypothetical protein